MCGRNVSHKLGKFVQFTVSPNIIERVESGIYDWGTVLVVVDVVVIGFYI